MLGLPASTEIHKQLPKTALANKFNLKPDERRLLDANVSRLELVNQISPQTIPALAAGTKVKGIYVLKVALKVRDYDERVACLILRLIPQKVVLCLAFEEEVQLAVLHEKLLVSPWRSVATYGDATSLKLEGVDLDAVWLGFKHQIADIVFEDGIEVSENTLSQALKKAEEREELRKQIERLEKAINTEKQPRRKFALHQEIQKLRKKFSE
mgnify:CR=1 FL=1